jgi:hypothetical protein
LVSLGLVGRPGRRRGFCRIRGKLLGVRVAATRESSLRGAAAFGLSTGSVSKLKPGPGQVASDVERNQRARIHGAMVEIVGERGYRAVTVRELARLAGVSTRAFYEQFEGKEECFFSTVDLIPQRAAGNVLMGQKAQDDWQERLRLAAPFVSGRGEGN